MKGLLAGAASGDMFDAVGIAKRVAKMADGVIPGVSEARSFAANVNEGINIFGKISIIRRYHISDLKPGGPKNHIDNV